MGSWTSINIYERIESESGPFFYNVCKSTPDRLKI